MTAIREQLRLPLLLIGTLAVVSLFASAPVSLAATICVAGAEQCYLQAGKTKVKRKAYGKRRHLRAKIHTYEAPPLSAPSYEFRQSPSYGCNVMGCD
jgi:hypothetical protein